MAYTVASLKVSLVVAVCVVLLHSSMCQQPAPAPAPAPVSAFDHCYSQCTSNCSTRCQAIADSDARKCNFTLALYADCFKGCHTNRCNGNSAFARGTCDMGSCSPRSCGCPCAIDCCKSCTDAAGQATSQCMAAVGRDGQFCMPDCPNYCNRTCAATSAPPPPPL